MLLGTVIAAAAPGIAQEASCPALVRQALDAVAQVCSDLGRNSVCYGNTLIEATFDDTADVRFEKPADYADIAALRTLRTFPLDETLGLWGVAVMNLQANLPDTLPGQGVKFLLYGDAVIENRVGDSSGGQTDYGPMQAFYFTTGLGNLKCRELPPSSLVIQSPKGYHVQLNANGLDVIIGSTVALTAERGKTMRIATLEGRAITRQGSRVQVIPAGFEASVELGGDDGLTPISDVSEPDIIIEDDWQAVIETGNEVFDELIDFPDSTDEYGSWDDFCADPVNADLCALPDDLCPNGGCGSVCGDLVCDLDEGADTCPADCGFDDNDDNSDDNSSGIDNSDDDSGGFDDSNDDSGGFDGSDDDSGGVDDGSDDSGG